MNAHRFRAHIESGSALLTGLLCLVTLLDADWIEQTLGWDPDGGDGVVEWAVVAGLALVAVGLAFAARRSYRVSLALDTEH